MPGLATILLNYNGAKDTCACIDSLLQSSTPCVIIVVDNGSIDSSLDMLKSYGDQITLIETKKNLGYAEGNNVGIRYAIEHGYDTLFILNNDTICPKDAMGDLLSALEPNTIIAPLLVQYFDPQKIDHLGGVWEEKKANFSLLYKDAPITQEIEEKPDYLCGAAFMCKKEVFEQVGLFDPRFFLLWEEADFFMRAKKLGLQLKIIPKARIYHKGSQSFSGGKPQMHYYWWRNRLLWMKKNLPFFKRVTLTFTVILPELLKELKRFFFKKNSTQERMKKIAAFRGAYHFFSNRFGEK